MIGVSLDKVAVYMTAEEVEDYKMFCKFHEMYKVMEQAKVFEIVHGAAIIHFGAIPGEILTIKGDLILYKKGKL